MAKKKKDKFVQCPKCGKTSGVVFSFSEGTQLYCHECTNEFFNWFVDDAFERGKQCGRKEKADELKEWLNGL